MPYKTINNIQIYFEESGEGNPILFIHGLGSSTKDWENQLPYFSKSYKTISIDLRGHGKTGSIKGSYSIKGFADDVSKLLSTETKPVTIVGISMGGAVAFQLAADNPKMVKSLIIINSFIEIPDSKKGRRAIRMRKLIPKILGMRIMGKIIGKKVFPKESQVALRTLIASRWAENKVKDYLKSVNAIATWSIKARLSGIICPVLVVGAEFDYISAEMKQEYTKLIPNAKFVIIPDSHHAVSMEKPGELNTVIDQFLEEI